MRYTENSTLFSHTVEWLVGADYCVSLTLLCSVLVRHNNHTLTDQRWQRESEHKSKFGWDDGWERFCTNHSRIAWAIKRNSWFLGGVRSVRGCELEWPRKLMVWYNTCASSNDSVCGTDGKKEIDCKTNERASLFSFQYCGCRSFHFTWTVKLGEFYEPIRWRLERSTDSSHSTNDKRQNNNFILHKHCVVFTNFCIYSSIFENFFGF